jgi:hypothetical protein
VSDTESAGNCERCHRPLHGHLGVFDGVFCGIRVVTIRETSPRNWICCDACAATLCHDCCGHPETGYCDACIAAYGIRVERWQETRSETGAVCNYLDLTTGGETDE